MVTSYPENIEKDLEDEAVILMQEQTDIFKDIWKEILKEKTKKGIKKNSQEDDDLKEIKDIIELTKNEASVLLVNDDIRDMVDGIVKQVQNYCVNYINESSNAVAAVDMFKSDYIDGRKMKKYINQCVKEIKSMPNYYFDKVETIIFDGMKKGQSIIDIGELIDKASNDASKYSRLIARNNIGNITGFVEESQLTGMGLTRGIWRTMKDEDVRERHNKNEGKEFDLSEGIDGEKPKSAHLCRCETEIKDEDILSLVA